MNVDRDPVIEKLSALMDNELSVSDARTLLGKMANDSNASQKWRRYNLAREAMLQKNVLLTDAGFAGCRRQRYRALRGRTVANVPGI